MPEQPPAGDASSCATIARWPAVAAGLLLMAHVALLGAHFQPASASRDSHGYLIQARLLAQRAHTWIEPRSSVDYVPETWIDRGDGRYFCTYPPGLPVMLAPAWFVGGSAAVMVLLLGLGPLTLLGMGCLARHWLAPSWSLVAMLLLACNTTFNTQVLTADSHLPATCLLVWGTVALLRWEHTRAARTALLAGLLLGAIPTVRYLEGLFLVAAFTFVILATPRGRERRRSVVALGLGAGLPLAALAGRNTLAYGAPWRTGYGFTGDSGAFGLDNLLSGGPQLVWNIPLHGVGPVAWLAVVALGMMLARPAWRTRGALLALLIVPTTVAYCCVRFEQFGHGSYAVFSPGQSPMRYLLPTFVGYIVAAAWLLQTLGTRVRWLAWAAAALLAVAVGGPGLRHSLEHMDELEAQNRELVVLQRLLHEHVPAGQVVVADRGLCRHLAFVGQWELADASLLLFASGCDRGHLARVIEWHPLKPWWERAGDQNFRAYYKASPLHRLNSLRDGVHRLAPEGGQVYWVGTPLEMHCFDQELTSVETLIEVARSDGDPASGRTITPSGAASAVVRWTAR